MQAAIIRRFGDPDVFELAEVPDPTPRAGEVLVRIEAASVNPIDYKVRRFGPAIAPELPAILGCDFAGVVERVGPGVEDVAPGDRVYGCAGGVRGFGGSYAGRIAADTRLIAPAPPGLDARAAAALPLVTITAWEALDRAGVGPGTTLLVRGAAGGVGHIAVQLAAVRGAHVVAMVSSSAKAAIARGFGAAEAIDYRATVVADEVARLTGGRGFDVVFDTTGGDDLETAFAATRLNGQVVAIVSQFAPDLSTMQAKALSLHVVFMLTPMLHDVGRAAHGAILREAAALATAGKLRPLLDPERFGLADLALAHAKLEEGRASGKIVIDVG